MERDQIRDIADRVNILDVVSDYVTLRKAGASHKGLCPFHQEKTPSFNVHPGRQSFHCFGCGEGGDVFDFLQKVEGMTFMEALEDVARRAGVELPRAELTHEEKRAAGLRSGLYDVNDVAADSYQRALYSREGSEARAYLERRGFPRDAIERFGLGFAPDAWEHLVDTLAQKRMDATLGEKVGLLRPGKRGGYYDLFRNRVMIPIHNTRGKVVAFGGRALGDQEPKYLNSPESPIYDKSSTLYGLAQARRAIRNTDQAVIVEGYFDCQGLVNAGVEQVVATCGTALTPGHLRILQRYTKTAVLVFDADEAGFKAACRSLDVFLDQSMWPLFVGMPEGQDPDDFVRANGGDAFRELLQGAEPLMDRYLGDVIQRHAGKPGASERVLEEVTPTLRRITPVSAQPYWAWLADELGLEENVMMAHVRGLRRPRNARPAPEKLEAPSLRKAFAREEWALLMLLLHHPADGAGRVHEEQVVEMMQSRPLAELVSMATADALDGREPNVVRMLDSTEDAQVRKLLTDVSLSEDMFPPNQVERAFNQLILQIRLAYKTRMRDEAKRRARTAPTGQERQEAAAEVIRLSREIDAIKAALNDVPSGTDGDLNV